MKKAKVILYVLLCVAISVASVFATIGILKGCEKSDEIDEREADFEENEENEKKKDYDKENKDDESGEKTRLTKDGVDYLVTDGKLIITGNGTVTREAVLKLSPKFNIIDFESGTFDIDDGAFEGLGDVTDVCFRNNVHTIGDSAFKKTSLAVVCLGSSIEEIGDEAFSDCCIDYVFINNENIYHNFDSRYDFGEVALTAENVCVYEEIFDVDDAEQGIAGDYLAQSETYDDIKEVIELCQSNPSYDFDRFQTVDDSGFVPLYGDYPSNYMSVEYKAKTNVIEYSFHSYVETPWKGRNIVRYDEEEDEDSVTKSAKDTKSTTTKSEKSNTSVSSGSNFVDNRTSANTNRGQNCYICNGSGKKTCTSCNGQGYTYEYDNYSMFGDGKLTKIKKTCMVCHGTGRVTCYH